MASEKTKRQSGTASGLELSAKSVISSVSGTSDYQELSCRPESSDLAVIPRRPDKKLKKDNEDKEPKEPRKHLKCSKNNENLQTEYRIYSLGGSLKTGRTSSELSSDVAGQIRKKEHSRPRVTEKESDEPIPRHRSHKRKHAVIDDDELRANIKKLSPIYRRKIFLDQLRRIWWLPTLLIVILLGASVAFSMLFIHGTERTVTVTQLPRPLHGRWGIIEIAGLKAAEIIKGVTQNNTEIIRSTEEAIKRVYREAGIDVESVGLYVFDYSNRALHQTFIATNKNTLVLEHTVSLRGNTSNEIGESDLKSLIHSLRKVLSSNSSWIFDPNLLSLRIGSTTLRANSVSSFLQSDFPPFDLQYRAAEEKSTAQIGSCRSIAKEPNGKVLPDDCHDPIKIYTGLSCTMNCAAGYVLSGSKVRTCLSKGTWSGWKTRCEMPCTRLKHPSNGVVSPRLCIEEDGIDKPQILAGENCYFFCKPGYKLLGSIRTTCQKDGRWSSVPSICKSTCAGLSPPENGHIVPKRCSNTRVVEESFCTFYCDDDYVLRGEVTTSCLGEGTWTSEIPYCCRTCPKLPRISHAKVHPSICWYGKVDAGLRCIFECETGYELLGLNERMCDPDVGWTGKNPTCVKMCSKLHEGNNLLLPYQCTSQSSAPGKKCAASCENGFEIIGQSQLVCQQDGSWNSDFPSCSAVCIALPTPVFGYILCSGHTEGSSCSLFCPDRYVLFGARSVTCGLDGSWSKPIGYCKNTCRRYEIPAQAIITPTKCGYEVSLSGQICQFECENGYSVSGPFQTVCLDRGEWNDHSTRCFKESQFIIEISTHMRKTCLKLNPDTSYVTKEEWNDCVSGARYTKWSLMPNRLIRNVDADKCLTVQSATSSMSFLVAQKCTPTNLLQVWDWPSTGNGAYYLKLRDQNIFAWEGYNSLLRVLTVHDAENVKSAWKLFEVSKRTLVSFYGAFNNGKCPPLLNGLRGRWSPTVCSTEAVPSFSHCSYICTSGFFLLTKNADTQCVNGIWTKIVEPNCEEACPGLTLSPESLLTVEPQDCLQKYVNQKTVCATKCPNNTLLVGERYLICVRGGVWSFSAPQCVAICPVLEVIGSGFVIQSDNCTDYRGLHLDSSTCEIQCNEGYSLSTMTFYRCIRGAWDNESPRCKRTCEMPEFGENGISACSQAPFYLEGKSCTFSCDTGFALQGNDTITCLTSGRWSLNIPTCKRVCPILATSPELVVESMTCRDLTELTVGTICYLTCAPGYESVDVRVKKTCLSSGVWTGSSISCQQTKQFFIQNTIGQETYCLTARFYPFHDIYKVALKPNVDCRKSARTDLWVMESDNRIRNVGAGRCLGIQSKRNYASVQFYSCDDPLSERWQCILKYGRYTMIDQSGDYFLRHETEIKALEVSSQFDRDWHDRDAYEWKAADLEGKNGSICGIAKDECPKLELTEETNFSVSDNVRCQSNVQVGDSCRIFCTVGPQAGVEYPGIEVQCLDHGVWSLADFDCSYKSCPPLVLKPNSSINDEACVNSTTSIDGSRICSISCFDGFARVAENPYINITVCLPNGRWSEPPPECIRYCAIPVPPLNGQISQNCNGNTTILDGEVCEIFCDYDHLPRETNVIKCISGSWNDSLPICRLITIVPPFQCGPVMNVTNGTVLPELCFSSLVLYATECTITCDADYLPDRSALSTIKCQANGKWNGTMSKCTKKCPIFDYVDDYNRINFGSYLYMYPERCSVEDNLVGDRCYVDCNRHYMITGSQYFQTFQPFVTCLSSGNWLAGPWRDYSCSSPFSFKIRHRSTGLCVRAKSADLILFDSCDLNDWSMYWIPADVLLVSKSDISLCLFVDNNFTTSTLSLKRCNKYDERMKFDCGIDDRKQEILLYYTNRKLTYIDGSNRVYTTVLKDAHQTPTAPSLFDVYDQAPGYQGDNICTYNEGKDSCSIFKWASKEHLVTSCKYNPLTHRHLYDAIYNRRECLFSCDSGYTLVGSERIQCYEGNWLGSEPACVKRCPPLSSPDFSVVLNTSCTFDYSLADTVCEFECQEGFVAAGDRYRTCRATGEWSGVDIVCSRTCQQIKPVQSATIVPSECTESPQIPETVCSTVCSDGYENIGIETQLCQRSGEWSTPQSSCVIVCPALSLVIHGKVTPSDCVLGKMKSGSICVYKCDAGYNLVGPETRKCRLSGLWSETPAQCLRSCPPLIAPKNGALQLDTALKNAPGAIVKVNCNLDYVANMNPFRECLPTGVWSGEMANCIHETQFMLLQKSPPSPAVCLYTDETFIVRVRPSVECETSSHYLWAWTDITMIRNVGANKCLKMSSTFPEKFLILAECDGGDPALKWTCSAVGNRNLLTLEHQKLVPVFGALSQTKVLLLTEELIQFLSEASIAPLAHLQWLAKTSESNQTSLCTAKKVEHCPQLKIGNHLKVNPAQCKQSVVTLRTECTFSCEHGYIMKERVDSTVCLNSGYWTTTPPECIPSCVKLVVNSSVLVSPQKCYAFDFFREGEICQFRCRHREFLVGPSLAVCMRNGYWSSSPPICKKTCNPLKIPIYGQAEPAVCTNLSRRIVEGTECVLSCLQKERILTGSEKRRCTEQGAWSGYDSECIKPCNELPELYHSVVSPPSCVDEKSPTGAICSIQCKDGFYPTKIYNRTCMKNSTWSGISPACELYCANMEATIENGVINPLSCSNDKSRPGMTCGIECNSGFDVVGDRTVFCTTDGVWSGELGACTRRCPVLEKPLHGTLHPVACLDLDMFVGMTCSPACPRDFIVKGSGVRDCMGSGEWTGKEAECVPGCPAIGKVESAMVKPKSCLASSQPLGGSCIIQCHDGMVTADWKSQAELTCLVSGVWDLHVLNRCLKKCKIPAVPNGYITCDGTVLQDEALEGQKCFVKCDPYHVATSHPVSTCVDESWSPPIPDCDYTPYPLLMVQRVDLDTRCVGIEDSKVVMHPWIKCRFEESGVTWSWKSRYSIVNMASGLCLAAFAEAIDEPLIVSPCDDNNRLQQWDCEFVEGFRIFLRHSTLGPGLRYSQMNEVTLQKKVGPNSLFYTFNPISDDELGTLCSMRPEKGCKGLPLPVGTTVAPQPCSLKIVPTDTICYLSCIDEGQSIVGAIIVTCKGSGLWSPETLGKCMSSCPPIPFLQGNVFYNDERCVLSRSGVGDSCTFSCPEGYALLSEFKGRNCLETGIWSEIGSVECIKQCPTLRDPANAKLNPPVCTIGACAIECNVGFRLDGPRIRFCKEFGAWSGTEFSCIKDVQFSISTRNHVLQIRMCLTILDGMKVAKEPCKQDRKSQMWRWKSHVGLENIVSETCLALRPEVAGNKTRMIKGKSSDDSEYKSALNYVNFRNSSETSDVHVTTCDASDPSQRWGCETHFSKNKFRLLLIDRGQYLDSGPQLTTRVTLVTKPYRSSKWAISNHEGISSLCSKRSSGICSPLQPLHGGVITPSVCQSEFITVGTKCHFRCAGDFVNEGSGSTVCRKDGFWTNLPPVCLGIYRCPILIVKPPLLARPPTCQDRQVPEGRKCSFQCPDTHILYGKEAMLCGEKRTWPDELPACRFYCPGLPPPIDGNILPESCQNLENEIGKNCTFTCSDGYDVIGSAYRVCEKDGAWSGERTVCRKLCQQLVAPLHSTITPASCLTGKSRTGAVCLTTCNTGFRLLGIPSTACDHGVWSEMLPSCSGDICHRHAFEKKGVTSITYSKLVNEAIVRGSSFRFECLNGFRVNRVNTRSCADDGAWIGPERLCIAVACEPLQRLYRGRIEPDLCIGRQQVVIGTRCSFSCEDGYILYGPASTECFRLGKWSEETTPQCHDTHIISHVTQVLVLATPSAEDDSANTEDQEKKGKCLVAPTGKDKSPYVEDCYPVSTFKLWQWYGSSRIQNVGNRLCWELNVMSELRLDECNLNNTYQQVYCGDLTSASSNLQVFVHGKLLTHFLKGISNVTAGSHWIASESIYALDNTNYGHLSPSRIHAHGSPICTFMCGGVLTLEEGDFSTPNFPRNYPSDVTCKWTILTPGKVLYVDFSSILLSKRWETSGEEMRCSTDGVHIFEGDSGDNRKADVITKICAPQKDLRVSTVHGQLHIELYSDHRAEDNQLGFAARWFCEDLPPILPSCGISDLLPANFDNNTSRGYPWQVAIVTWKRLCDGAFIGNRFVLTSAHCVEHIRTADDIVHISVAFQIGTQSEFLNKLKRRQWDNADRLWVHSDYDRELMLNNVAVLRLSHGMQTIEDLLHPICMPDPEVGRVERPGDHCVVSGFSKGLVSAPSQVWRFTKIATAVILSKKSCKTLLQLERGVTFDGNALLCAELFFNTTSTQPVWGEKRSLDNDGGNVLQCLWNENWYAVGVFNFPLSDVKDGIFYVFTQMINNQPWIQAILDNGFLSPSNIFK